LSHTVTLISLFIIYSALAPVGFFDPAGLSKDKDDGEIKKIREAELKHGRISMIAALGFIVGEVWNPLWDGKITGPAINQFQQADAIFPNFWLFVTFFIGLVEYQTITIGWESQDDMKARGATVANLKDDYVNGDIGFDPLNFKGKFCDTPEKFELMQTKELQNGRLAMLGIAGMVAQELVTESKIF
jgi:hypothetical protein